MEIDAGIESILQPQAAPPPQAPEMQQAEPAVQAPVQAQDIAPPQPTVHQVPLPELLEERGRRQAAEREAQLYRQQVQQFFDAQRVQQQPQIDPVTDPEGAYRAVIQQNQQLAAAMSEQAIHQRANMSQMLAEREHGSQVVADAVQAAIQTGLNGHFMRQADPYKALLDWHKSNQVAKEVGTDLNAFRQKIEAETRQRLLAEMQAGRQAPQTLPPSLSTATNAASNNAPIVEEANDFFKSMFKR